MKYFSLGNLYFVFEFGFLLLSVFLWPKIKNTTVAYLVFYVAVVFLCDIYGLYRRVEAKGSNFWMNDLLIPFEFLFSFYLYSKILNTKVLKRVAYLFVCVYLVVFFIDEVLYKQTYARLYLRSFLSGVIMLLLLVILYYYELLNSQYLYRFYAQPEFWISSGFLIFYLGTLPFHLGWNITADKFFNVYLETKYIFYILLCMMYIFFSIGLLCLKQKGK